MTTTTEKQELLGIKDGSLYFPPYAINLESQDTLQVRVVIQGLGGIGKTFAIVRTFPNIVVLNYDRGLAAHRGRKDVTEIPFYDDDFITSTLRICNDTIQKKIVPYRRPNRRDALLKFLEDEGDKFTKDQNLFLDSWTTIHNAFDIQERYEPVFSPKTGKEDEYAFWENKIAYSVRVMEIIKTLRCGVILTIHESFHRDKDDGRIIGIEPLMQGKFKDQLSSHFTDWFRHKYLEINEKNFNKLELELIKEFSTEVQVGNFAYVWQVKKDDIALNCKTSRLKVPADVRYIPACYNAFMKYA